MKREIDSDLILVGTNHVSEESSEEVKEVIEEEEPDVVGVELDRRRYGIIKKELMDNEIEQEEVDSIRCFLTNPIGYLFDSIQSSISNVVDTESGTDMETAVEISLKDSNKDLVLLDRDIRITMNRLRDKLSFKEKIKLLSLLVFSLLKIKDEKDNSEEKGLNSISDSFPEIKEVLVDERDKYMADKLQKINDNSNLKIVAVIGKGHMDGVEKYLKEYEDN